MRFSCQIEVFNRLCAAEPQSRRQRSTITVGGYGPSGFGGKLWILHQTAQNTSGIRYKVNSNVLALFTKFLHEGKATVRLREPPIDLRIMGDTRTLTQFVDLIKHFLLGRTPMDLTRRLNITNLETASKKMEPGPTKSLVIRSMKEFRSLKGAFPSSLNSLTINNVILDAVEPKIFRLQHLNVLDLRCNKIRLIPKSIELLSNLTLLNLAGNELGSSRRGEDWDWLRCKSVRKTLKTLDLSSNQISVLPNTLADMQALYDLSLHDNCLVSLPNNLGFAKNLKFVSLRRNCLKYVPASFLFSRIDTLDLSENNFQADRSVVDSFDSSITLKNIAARAVLRYRLQFDETDLPRELIRYLESACFCICGKATFPSTPTTFATVSANRLASCVTYQTAIVVGYRQCPRKCSLMFSS